MAKTESAEEIGPRIAEVPKTIIGREWFVLNAGIFFMIIQR